MPYRKFVEGGPVSMPSGNESLVPPMTVHELKANHYPNVAERIIRSAMHVTAVVLMLLVIVLLISAFMAAGRLADRIDKATTPDPAVTGCPFGDGECGG